MITKEQKLYNLTTGIKIQVSNLLRIYHNNDRDGVVEAIVRQDMAYKTYLVESERIEKEYKLGILREAKKS